MSESKPRPGKEKDTSVDDWLKTVRPPPRKTQEDIDELYDDLDASASEFGFPSAGRGYEDERDSYVRPRFGVDGEDGFASRAGTGERRREVIREEEEEDDISSFIAQTRQRVRARAMAEPVDDEVLKAWREQMEARAQRTGGGED